MQGNMNVRLTNYNNEILATFPFEISCQKSVVFAGVKIGSSFWGKKVHFRAHTSSQKSVWN